MHDDQLSVTFEVVRDLVADQFPEWRKLSIKPVTSPATVHAIFRIGERLVARLPLRSGEVDETRQRLEAEAAAARELFGQIPFATPEPIALGEPGVGYPLPWSIQTWLPGVTGTDDDPGDSAAFAHDLARLIRSLRAIDPRGRTFRGGNRGGDLHHHDLWMETCFDESDDLFDVGRLRSMWAELRELHRIQRDVMSHGDLIPGNVLIDRGRLVGVIDVGGFGPADPALDLVGAWHLLDDDPRNEFREDLGCDDLEWERGRAWAFEQAMGLVWYYQTSNPTMSALGRRTVERLQAAE